MSATLTYPLPTAERLAEVEDLLANAKMQLEDVVDDLKRPFDGDDSTEAEPVTMEFLGRIFWLAREARNDAEEVAATASKLEQASVELFYSQEGETAQGYASSSVLGHEPYLVALRRQAVAHRVAAEKAEALLASAELNPNGPGGVS